ncbi:MAG: hypothetical protein QOD63_2426 [Actinomycetota bacterium]|nr:hypothetical protein [Actinomycetota bacterium]
MTAGRRARPWRPLRVAGSFGMIALTAVVTACGGATGTANVQPGDVVGYCALSQEVNTAGVGPTAGQVTELIRLAPPEIRADVTTALQAGEASDTGVQAFSRILAFESSHC